MSFISRFSPIRAVRDLRFFLAQRQPHELWFGILAITLTGLLLVGFAKDSRIAPVYKRDIVYVEQWSLDRTDDQIRAKQAIDQVERDRFLAERKRLQAERQASFKRLEDKLDRYGL